MPATLTIRDETAFGQDAHTFTMDLLTEQVSVRELIRSRVYEEVQMHNANQPEYFRGLVQPTDAQVTFNGYRLRKKRTINWEEQYDKALRAFSTNCYFIIVGDRLVEDLDEVVEVRLDTRVSFIKRVPMVGG